MSVREAKIPKALLREPAKNLKEIAAIKTVIIDQILREKILPETPEFEPHEVDHIYVTKRNPLSYSTRETLNGRRRYGDRLPRNKVRSEYEEDFYERFWDKTEKPIIFLIGQRGCGKSTFLDLFFRGDCPSLSRSLGAEREKDYRLKLRVQLNLRNEEGKSFIDNFWDKARQSIEKCFENRCGLSDKPAGTDESAWKLDRHVDFWRRALDLEHPAQQNVFRKRAATTGTSYKEEVLAASRLVPITSEEWVKDALAFFGRDERFFAFLVIVMDNLDQSSVDSQKEAIRIAKGLVSNHSLKLYKIIVTLWPSSYTTLKFKMQPLSEEATRFELSGLDTDDYYEKRFAGAKEASVTTEELTWAQGYARDFYIACRKTFFFFFDSFAGDDIRFRQKLVISTLTNPSLIDNYNAIKKLGDTTLKSRSQTREAFLDIGEYLNFSSLLAGDCEGHERDLSPVANMFYASETDAKLNLLLGFHLLWILDYASENSLTRNTIMDYLESLGHKPVDVEQALTYFLNKEILRAPEVPEPDQYFINYNFVKSYIYLAGQLPYLDNMAMVTPISAKRLRKIEATTGNTQFAERKRSTLEFLDEVREVESDWFTKSKRRPSLDELIGVEQIPSVFLTLCESYSVNNVAQRNIPRINTLLKPRQWDVLTARFEEIKQLSYAVFKGRAAWR